MPEPHIISDASTWPTICADPQRHQEVLAWLRASGIEPDDVPVDCTVCIETTLPAGGQVVIRYEVFLRNADGHRYIDPRDGDRAAREKRTVPLAVAVPTSWGSTLPVLRQDCAAEVSDVKASDV